jgi:hypothetical protein
VRINPGDGGLVMSKANRRRQPTRQEKRAANLRRRFGDEPPELYLFPMTGLEPPRSPAEARVAAWFLQAGLEVLARQARGELYCLVCGGPIALDPPPFVGVIKPEGRDSEFGVVVVCEGCARAADGYEDLREMVAEAVGGALAPASPCH